MRNPVFRLASLPFLLTAFCLILSAQTITGSIVGSVVDPSGLAVSNAGVTLVQVTTGATRTAMTDERGDFTIGSLQPGESLSMKAWRSNSRRNWPSAVSSPRLGAPNVASVARSGCCS
ncbi:MAG: carboxypeptidase-like regulatory domain-containing protein [Acidobacteria bacterium]|nr:carboxypeptidase-like regulatory domain-containing protein [Acidobacteriota bacterium]